MVFESQYSSALYSASYADSLYRVIERNRDRIAQHFPKTNAKTSSLNDTRKYSAQIESKQRDKTYFMHLILKKDTNAPIGFIDIKNINWKEKRAEMGAFVDIQFESMGIMTHFSNKLLHQIALEQGFNTLFCRIVPQNIKSIKLVERNGFILKQTHENLKADMKGKFNLYEKDFYT